MYEKTNWVNDQAPAINAGNLNKIEQGIYDAYEKANTNEININNLEDEINEINTKPLGKIGLSSSVSTTANNYNKIPFNSIIQMENGLLLSNNGIQVEKKGKYIVNVNARLNLSGTVYLAIRKNNVDSNEALVSCNINGGVHTVTGVVNCEAGDIIYGYVYSSNSITIFGGGNPPVWVSMTVTKL